MPSTTRRNRYKSRNDRDGYEIAYLFVSFTLVLVPRNNDRDVLAFNYNKEAQGNCPIVLRVAVVVSCIVQV